MKNKIKIQVLAIFLIAGLQAFSQEVEPQEDKSGSPYFFVKGDDAETDRLPLKKTWAEANIAGVIADVTIHQIYKNEGQHPLEAIYTFPASTRAAVYAMEMKIGERIIRAKIEEKEKARQDYEKAKEDGKRTSLLEQSRPNVFTMNVANIMPGDEIEVQLSYTELLVPEEGTYSFVYPTVAGPRYAGESDNSKPDNAFAHTPYQHQGEDPFYDFDLKIKLSTGVPIQNIDCETHKVNTSFQDLDKATVELDPSEQQGGNRDFVLDYQLAGEEISSGIMLYEHGDENFFLAMIQPPKRVEPKDIPPREYVFIMDISGSMSGYPTEVSQKLMRNLLSNLRPEDRFNVMVFAGSSGWWTEHSKPATPDNIQNATSFVDFQQGGGGTNILSALRKAMDLPREYEELSRSFVIITDGYVMVEKEAFDLIRQNCDLANTFAFGIGSAVNRYIIEGIAHMGMGEPFIVIGKNQASEKAEKFREYISSPVLTQIKMDAPAFEIYDVEPFSIPDVFAERPVIIYGKYRGEAKGRITLKGYSGNKRWKASIDVSEAKPDEKNAALRYLWARKRIQLLDDYGRLGSSAVREETTELGLKYNLLTNYTSFIAIEETRTNEGEIVIVNQPLPLPLHVSNAAVGFEMGFQEKISPMRIQSYRQVLIHTEMDVKSKSRIRKHIERKLMPQLDNCLMNLNSIDSFTLKVDENGKVESTMFTGGTGNEEIIKCIEGIISRWNLQHILKGKALVFEVEL